MARLWRTENAKSLHVTDVDGAVAGRLCNLDVIEQMIRAVDIPIELSGGIRSFEDAQRAFNAGVMRIVIGTMLLEHPDEAIKTLETFGASRVVLGLDISNSRIKVHGREIDAELLPLTVMLNAKQLGFTRIIYKDILRYGTDIEPNYPALQAIAEQLQNAPSKTKMRITVAGGICSIKELLKLQEFESLGIDSVIIGRALYENKFSCQQLWRMSETGYFPYTARV
jgi:phosphoribosylformimino-5-aminoimidazole carboxamide ribotide isomerase